MTEPCCQPEKVEKFEISFELETDEKTVYIIMRIISGFLEMAVGKKAGCSGDYHGIIEGPTVKAERRS